MIYLAPVLLHPRLIEARRSGLERISGGLEDVVTVNVFARPLGRIVETVDESRVQGCRHCINS